jgi:hypothetical protein
MSIILVVVKKGMRTPHRPKISIVELITSASGADMFTAIPPSCGVPFSRQRLQPHEDKGRFW